MQSRRNIPSNNNKSLVDVSCTKSCSSLPTRHTSTNTYTRARTRCECRHTWVLGYWITATPIRIVSALLLKFLHPAPATRMKKTPHEQQQKPPREYLFNNQLKFLHHPNCSSWHLIATSPSYSPANPDTLIFGQKPCWFPYIIGYKLYSNSKEDRQVLQICLIPHYEALILKEGVTKLFQHPQFKAKHI